MDGTQLQEPSVFEILYPLVRRWKLLVGGVGVVLVFTGILSLLLPKQYRTSELLEIGAVVDKQLEDAYVVAQIINSEAFCLKVVSQVGLTVSAGKLNDMIQAQTDPLRASSPLVTINVMADSPEHAVRLANTIAEEILKRHAPLFQEKWGRYNDYAAQLKNRIDDYTKETEKLDRQLNSLKPSGEVTVAATLLLEQRLSDSRNQLLGLRREIRDVEAYPLSEIHSHPTKVVAKPVLPVKPSKPNLLLNLLIAGLAGTFVMISLILLLEQYKQSSLRR